MFIACAAPVYVHPTKPLNHIFITPSPTEANTQPFTSFFHLLLSICNFCAKHHRHNSSQVTS